VGTSSTHSAGGTGSFEDVDRRSDERRPSDEGLVEDDADAVPVRSRRQHLGHRLLGRHVPSRAHDLVRLGEVLVDAVLEVGRDPEVQDHHPPILRDEHVRRFDVAVQLARAVKHLHALHELPQSPAKQIEVGRRRLRQRLHRRRSIARAEPNGRRHLLRMRMRHAHDGRRRPRFGAGARLANVRQEIGAVDELHREKDVVVLGHHEFVETHEVGVMNVGQSPELLLEAEERRRGEFAQTLDRDDLTAFVIERLVDDAHPALADATYDLVPVVAPPLGGPGRLGRGVGRQGPAVGPGGGRRLCRICGHCSRLRFIAWNAGDAGRRPHFCHFSWGKRGLVCGQGPGASRPCVLGLRGQFLRRTANRAEASWPITSGPHLLR
jgi:hypothetical protein